MKRTLAFLATLFATAAFAEHRDIKVEDRSTFLPGLRLSADIHPRGEAPSVPHQGHAIELGFTGGSGADTQTRRAGAPDIVFGGQSFLAPTQLNHDFEWRFAEVAYRYRHFWVDGRVGLEFLGGLGFAEYELTMATATQRASEKLSSGGLVAGVGFIWRFLPSTSLQSRLTGFGSGETEGVSGAARWDLYIVQALGRHAALRVGLTAWNVVSDREEDDFDASLNSRIDARFSGISVGLDLAF